MEIKRTITSLFMVPTLKLPKDALINNGFINGYIKDAQREIQYDDSICILFKPQNLDQFRDFLSDEYERTKSIIEDYDHEDGFVVVVYKLNPAYKQDFDLVREGKYSKTSAEFQNLFPKIIKFKVGGALKNEISIQYRIFNRTQDLINFWEDKFGMTLSADQEVWQGFDETNETLNTDKIVQISSK